MSTCKCTLKSSKTSISTFNINWHTHQLMLKVLKLGLLDFNLFMQSSYSLARMIHQYVGLFFHQQCCYNVPKSFSTTALPCTPLRAQHTPQTPWSAGRRIHTHYHSLDDHDLISVPSACHFNDWPFPFPPLRGRPP